jgi:hypothetical protein
MRDILELCIRMDELADRAYESMAESCVDREVGAVLGAMAIEESAHTGWWRELVQAWDNGLLPDVYADTRAPIGLRSRQRSPIPIRRALRPRRAAGPGVAGCRRS